MLQLYRPSVPKSLLKRVLICIAALVIAFTSVTAIMLVKRHYDRAAAADCGDVFDQFPSWLTTRLNQNKSVYVQVANEKGVPWEMLAAVHYREFNMAVSNPANGQGIYQLYSSGQYFAPGAVSTDGFIQQTRLAADFLQSKASNSGTRTGIVTPRYLTTYDSDINLIKNTLFSYNGRASVYAQQAANFGYNASTQPFEGSPYVMNKFDCQRKAMGLITNDGGNSLNGTDTRMGAFTLYARLKGDSYWTNLQVGNISGCLEATNTSLTCEWRLFNPGTQKYTFTSSYEERNWLIAQGYLYQGSIFFGNNSVAPRSGNIPIFEVRSGSNSSLLTADYNEYTTLKSYGWADKGIAFYADRAGSNTGWQVHRLYNSSTGAHVWSVNESEINNLVASGFSDEGVSFTSISHIRQEKAPPQGQNLVYRFGGLPNNGHFWTQNLHERDTLIAGGGYSYEGAAWRASQSATQRPVYRLYSGYLRAHLYTTDANERDVLSSNGMWRDEGTAWYANPSSSGAPVYRLYSVIDRNHLYTTDANERDVLTRSGIFLNEGNAWFQP